MMILIHRLSTSAELQLQPRLAGRLQDCKPRRTRADLLASPGTYTITTGVNDGCGICGKTDTQTIVVKECDCVPVCSCPTLSVDGPSGLTAPGQPMTFTASVSGGDVTYNWTVSAGTISSG